VIIELIYFPPISDLHRLSHSPTGVACQTVPRMKEGRSYQAQTPSRRTPT